MVRGRGSVLRDGQGSPGSDQVVAGVMGETAGLAQSTGRADAEQRQKETEEKVAGFRLFRRIETDQGKKKNPSVVLTLFRLLSFHFSFLVFQRVVSGLSVVFYIYYFCLLAAEFIEVLD